MEAELEKTDSVSMTNSSAFPDERSHTQQAAVYVWATGQNDNIGDSLLRRGYINALRQLGPLTIWVGPASPGFVSGLGLGSNDKQEKSFASWYWSAMRSAIKRRTFVAMNAGEVPVSRRGAVKLAALAVLAVACRVRRGGGLWVGAGVPNTRPGLVIAYKAVALSSIYVRWRDHGSEVHVSRRGTAPDWAFALGTSVSDWEEPSSRNKLAIVLRGDRPMPSEAWMDWVRSLAAEHSLRPTLVVQVQRDTKRAVELAEILQADIMAWNHDHHATQELAVRKLYAASALVVGDRLHGLIVAATEGAIPLGWVETSKGKISRHFHVVGLDWVGEHEGALAGDLPVLDGGKLSQLAEELRAAVKTARENLKDTAAGLRL